MWHPACRRPDCVVEKTMKDGIAVNSSELEENQEASPLPTREPDPLIAGEWDGNQDTASSLDSEHSPAGDHNASTQEETDDFILAEAKLNVQTATPLVPSEECASEEEQMPKDIGLEKESATELLPVRGDELSLKEETRTENESGNTTEAVPEYRPAREDRHNTTEKEETPKLMLVNDVGHIQPLPAQQKPLPVIKPEKPLPPTPDKVALQASTEKQVKSSIHIPYEYLDEGAGDDTPELARIHAADRQVDEADLTHRAVGNEDDRADELKKQGFTYVPQPAEGLPPPVPPKDVEGRKRDAILTSDSKQDVEKENLHRAPPTPKKNESWWRWSGAVGGKSR
ncbi:hypothetical protein HDU93_008983 [Gonapodya sp. JEL0774]|nr:hypothetical protein HDU93_008983 [Gonapodya sp. JEL0774]